MRITAIRIKNHCQFKNFSLDFTDPETKQPLDRVCLIGSNGTGKSTILRFLADCLRCELTAGPSKLASTAVVAIRLSQQSHSMWMLGLPWELMSQRLVLFPNKRSFTQKDYLVGIHGSIESTDVWDKFWSKDDRSIVQLLRNQELTLSEDLDEEFRLSSNSTDLAIYAPPDGFSKSVSSLPQATLNEGLAYFSDIPAFHVTSHDMVKAFWKFLIYQVKKRERDEKEFQQRSDVQQMTVADAAKAFNDLFPEILVGLAVQWNAILEQAGLEFDVANARIPVQLNDKLEAYIRVAASQVQLPYDVLSTGIRGFLFRLGHIYSLYFRRNIQRGFLLIDEPEQSLFPDFLFDLVERYTAVTENTQFFTATHSPIIASQFKPSERFILEFSDDRSVVATRGISPEGDDPNDLLLRDFSVRSLYGKKGVESWKRFLHLRREIARTGDAQRKAELLNEYSRIGNDYNFAPHEISQ